jgi:predicted metal-dependent HD superfamily phosphohydrolase
MATAPRLRFGQLWHGLGAAGDSDEVFRRVAAAYAEPWRAYHTMDHILDCLARLDEATTVPGYGVEAEAALWFHDVVYDTHRMDNEARSADCAARVLADGGVPHAVSVRVRNLILTTAHTAPPQDAAGCLVSDIDLSMLGRPPGEFNEYERRIRREYDWVPELDFRRERTRILRALLERPHIYFTEHFRARYEARARDNLERALARLEV